MEHKEDKEEEDRKHMLMVAGIQVIRVKKRVPSEKVKVKEHAIAEEEREEEEEVSPPRTRLPWQVMTGSKMMS